MNESIQWEDHLSLPNMTMVPGGSFWMGSHDGQDNERPVHRVRVDSFELGVCPVTNLEYRLFLEATGHPSPPFLEKASFARPHQPVVGVSWHDARSYCDWLSLTAGCEFRLPTEAEWEYAARGGIEGERYPWGGAPPESLPDYHHRWQGGPEDVGLFSPNGYGLFNMCENIHEWCSDWYAPTYYQSSPETNPAGPDAGTRRSSRGGSWRHQVKVSRCAARSSIPPDYRYSDYGFRLARTRLPGCDP